MGSYTKSEMEDAIKSITSMIGRSEKAQMKFSAGTSQHTLQENRIHSLNIAISLVKQELTGDNIMDDYTEDEIKKAYAPIHSLISKSEKARGKLAKGTWQYKMLTDNLKALKIVSLLLEAVLDFTKQKKEYML